MLAKVWSVHYVFTSYISLILSPLKKAHCFKSFFYLYVNYLVWILGKQIFSYLDGAVPVVSTTTVYSWIYLQSFWVSALKSSVWKKNQKNPRPFRLPKNSLKQVIAAQPSAGMGSFQIFSLTLNVVIKFTLNFCGLCNLFLTLGCYLYWDCWIYKTVSRGNRVFLLENSLFAML